MPKPTKYRSEGGYYCLRLKVTQPNKCCEFCNYHPSKLELEMARFLYSSLPQDCIKTHCKLQIKPETKKYSALYWRVDFKVEPTIFAPNVPFMYIETKGAVLDEFTRNLQYLQLFDEYAYNRLWVVGYQAKRIDKNINQLSLAQFKDEFKKLLNGVTYAVR